MGENFPQRALQSLLRRHLNLLRRLPQKAFDGVANVANVRVDLHVRDRVDLKRNVSARIRILNDDVDRNESNVHAGDALQDRNAERATTAGDHVIAERGSIFGAGRFADEDQGFVGARDVEELAQQPDKQENANRDCDRQHDNEPHGVFVAKLVELVERGHSWTPSLRLRIRVRF